MAEPDDIELSEYQDEAFALIKAWMDRGLDPTEAVVILAGVVHASLVQLNFSLGQVVTLLAECWRKNNGKL